MATSGHRPQPGEDRKRRIYSVLLPVATGVTVTGLALNIGYRGGDLFNSSVLATLALILSALYLASRTSRIPLRVVEVVLLAALMMSLAVLIWHDLYAAPRGIAQGSAVIAVFAWLPLIFVVTFLAMSDTLALRFAIGYLIVVIGLTMPHAIATRGMGSLSDGWLMPIQLYLAGAVLITTLYFFSGFQRQARQAEVAVAAMRRLASTDVLTGIANRRGAENALALEVLRAERYGRPLGFILIDLDDFKSINDRFGHQAGDEALVTLARRLGHMTRATDTVGRWGGEEFMIIAPETDLGATRRLAEVVRAYVCAHPLVGSAIVSASIGVTACRPGDTLATLIARADAALYLAKESGKNQVRSERDLVVA